MSQGDSQWNEHRPDESYPSSLGASDAHHAPPQVLNPEEAYPSVEEPGAGFLVKLFIIPAIIVAIIVAVWFGFHKIAHMNDDPKSLVAALRRKNDAQWQAASSLADMLRDPRRADIRDNAEMAAELVEILNDELKTGQSDKEAIEFRVYLCRALGEFTAPCVVDSLLTAAGTRKSDLDRAVQFAALCGLTVHIDHVKQSQGKFENPRVLDALLKASEAEDSLLQSAAIMGLSAHGGEKVTARLKLLVHSGIPEVRFNAATTLSAQGDLAAVDVVVQMLDPAGKEALETETEELEHSSKIARVVAQGLIAANTLIDKNAQDAAARPDLQRLYDAITQVSSADLPREITMHAQSLVNAWSGSFSK